jgi:hypothetical protein
MSFPFKLRYPALTIAIAILFVGSALAQSTVPVPVSGYELFLGYNCVIGRAPATCGTTFSGWTGETSTGGWLKFPGTGQGAWSIRVNYTGQPMFDGSVTIVGGSWQFHFKNGASLRGTVENGIVTWPSDADHSIGCGNGVAVVNATLSVSGRAPATLSGCLHDLPKGSVIPPKVWGTFDF